MGWLFNLENMARRTYIVQFDDVTGYVDGFWPVSYADNMGTYVADGYLEIDGVKVLSGTAEVTGTTLVKVYDPTQTNTAVTMSVFEVDDKVTPTDVVERGDGDRDPYYPFET